MDFDFLRRYESPLDPILWKQFDLSVTIMYVYIRIYRFKPFTSLMYYTINDAGRSSA